MVYRWRHLLVLVEIPTHIKEEAPSMSMCVNTYFYQLPKPANPKSEFSSHGAWLGWQETDIKVFFFIQPNMEWTCKLGNRQQ